MTPEIEIVADQRGFTLLELMIALVVLAVGLLGIVGMIVISIRGNAFGSQMSQANTLAQAKIEELRNMTYTGLYGNCGTAGFPVVCASAPANMADSNAPNDSGSGGDRYTGGSGDGMWTYQYAVPPAATALPTGMTLVWGVKRNYPQPRMIWIMACVVWGGPPATNECNLTPHSSKSIHVVKVESVAGNF